MTDDKRLFHRFPCEGEVIIRCGTRAANTALIDLSLKGALMRRPAGWDGRPGDTCRIEILLAASDTAIAMEARVAHAETERIGLHCVHIDIDSVSFLKRFVELNLGDPALLERELSALG